VIVEETAAGLGGGAFDAGVAGVFEAGTGSSDSSSEEEQDEDESESLEDELEGEDDSSRAGGGATATDSLARRFSGGPALSSGRLRTVGVTRSARGGASAAFFAGRDLRDGTICSAGLLVVFGSPRTFEIGTAKVMALLELATGFGANFRRGMGAEWSTGRSLVIGLPPAFGAGATQGLTTTADTAGWAATGGGGIVG